MTNVEKGLSWIAVIIIVGLLIAWMWNNNKEIPESTPPTYKIGDPEPAKAFDTKLQEFNSELGK